MDYSCQIWKFYAAMQLQSHGVKDPLTILQEHMHQKVFQIWREKMKM